MTAGSVARRYARALVDVAATSNELETVHQEIRECAELLLGHRELRHLLTNPGILRRDKLQILDQVVSRLAHRPLTMSFLRLLLEAGRLPALESVLRAYETLMDERLGRVKAKVTAAGPLEAEAQEQLRQRLERVTGKQVYLEVTEDRRLLGGLVAQIGSLVYDGSLRTQLTRLREQLIGAT